MGFAGLSILTSGKLGAIWKHRTQYSSSAKRPGVKRYAKLVPAIFPIQSRRY